MSPLRDPKQPKKLRDRGKQQPDYESYPPMLWKRSFVTKTDYFLSSATRKDTLQIAPYEIICPSFTCTFCPFDTWRFIKAALAKNATSFNYHIDGFKVTAVTPDFFTVGCHKIPMSEVNEIAKRLDW
ncbi:MAG: hypothetical protein QM640_07695 [Niabella sp.]